MSGLIIRKVAVLGAGVMGAQIAAQLINARVPVVLFDLPSDVPVDGAARSATQTATQRSAIATRGVGVLGKLHPSPLGMIDAAQYIEVANYEDDLDLLQTCDVVIEAIAERLDYKKSLYQKIMPALRDDALLLSNTSGLSIAELAADMSYEHRIRFCGVHFFNPPRYMHLVELVPAPDTQAHLLDALETFLTGTLGKGVVRANDTPNFIANRVGGFSLVSTIVAADKYGLSFDVVDDLTGVRIGRSKSATCRTVDVVGLDTMAYVIGTMRNRLQEDPFYATYQEPAVLSQLIQQGALGQKTGAGFYKKLKTSGKPEIQVFNPKSGTYQPAGGKVDPLVERILAKKPCERFKLLRESSHPQAQFLWAVFRDLFHYIAVHLDHIATNARDVDLALRWGFGWQEGPFEIWQSAGWQQIAQWIQEDIDQGHALCQTPLPAWVFASEVIECGGVHSPKGSWRPAAYTSSANGKASTLATADIANASVWMPRSALPVYAKQRFHAPLRGEGGLGVEPHSQSAPQKGYGVPVDPMQSLRTVIETDAVRIWVDSRLGEDDVLGVSFKTKRNTISEAVLDGLCTAVERAENAHQGLVVWQPSSLQLGTPGGEFSIGADVKSVIPRFLAGGVKELEIYFAKFQSTMVRVKHAQVPVVSAVSGMALGGGCELALHSAARVAHFESYMGLVEAGIGLVPAGGGLKEAAIHAVQAARAQLLPDQPQARLKLLPFLSRWLHNVAMAKVSGSAKEAVEMGYLKPSDPIVMNVYELLETAKHQVRFLAAQGWRPPMREKAIPVAGRSALATLKGQLVNMRDGRFISEHDFLIASSIANVLCAGELEEGSLVDETWFLDRERETFIHLLGTQKTQERVVHTLQTGKPLRN